PSPLSPAPWTGGGVISSTDAAHYEMKDNTIIVVFGASGDLAKKKTLPALFGLFRQGYLPTDVQIVGYARTKMDKADFQSRAVSYIKNPDNDAAISAYDDGSAFDALNVHLEAIEAKYASKERNRLFYFALPPNVFVPVAKTSRSTAMRKRGEAVRERPGLCTRAVKRVEAVLVGGRDVPDRPLLGQGDGKEHTRPSVRQRGDGVNVG
ncbi:hypothetical protein B0H14DRAFT_2769838, partial [Mycena olivaceomarginata]